MSIQLTYSSFNVHYQIQITGKAYKSVNKNLKGKDKGKNKSERINMIEEKEKNWRKKWVYGPLRAQNANQVQFFFT